MTELYFDGAAEPFNPGAVASYGYVIRQGPKAISIGRGVAKIGQGATNNVAEYTALMKGLEDVLKCMVPGENVVVRGDSQLVIRQLEGKYAVNAELLKPLHAQAMELLRKFNPRVTLEWIPREKNVDADWQSKEAIFEAFKNDKELLGKLILPFGKHVGKSLAEVDDGYYRWLWSKSGVAEKEIPPRT